MKFEGTAVQVVTLRDTGATLLGWDEHHHLLRELIKTKTNCKFFIDEFPISRKDLESLGSATWSTTEVAKTLKILDDKSSQTWIALSALSLLDNTEDLKDTREIELSRHLPFGLLTENLTGNTSFLFCLLELRLRNSSSIGASVPYDISKLDKSGVGF